MTEQRYILQTTSGEHQNSTTFIFMSKSREVKTALNSHMKIRCHVKFCVYYPFNVTPPCNNYLNLKN